MCLPVQLTLQTRTDFKELQYGTHDAADYKQNTVSCHKYRNSRNVVATREPGMDQVPQPCATQALTRADFLTSTFWQRARRVRAPPPGRQAAFESLCADNKCIMVSLCYEKWAAATCYGNTTADRLLLSWSSECCSLYSK